MHAKYIVDTVWGNSFNTGLFVNVFKIDLFVHWTFRLARQLEISDKALMCPVGFNILYMHQLNVCSMSVHFVVVSSSPLYCWDIVTETNVIWIIVLPQQTPHLSWREVDFFLELFKKHWVWVLSKNRLFSRSCIGCMPSESLFSLSLSLWGLLYNLHNTTVTAVSPLNNLLRCKQVKTSNKLNVQQLRHWSKYKALGIWNKML